MPGAQILGDAPVALGLALTIVAGAEVARRTHRWWRKRKSSQSDESWRGMSAQDSGIRYRPPALFWRRPTLWFEPEGAVVRSRRGDALLSFGWEGCGQVWGLQFQQGSRFTRTGMRVVVPPYEVALAPGTTRVDVWLPSTWVGPPRDELQALVHYLAATPAARGGLAYRSRTSALVRSLRAEEWKRPRPPGRPMLGDKLDIHIAVDRSLDDLGRRRFGGRPVRGEPSPDTAVAAERARLLLSRVVTTRVTDDQLVATVARHLATAPWPFDLLLGPLP